MPLVICPGVHPVALTEEFVTGMGWAIAPSHIFPGDRHLPYDPWAVGQFFGRLESGPLSQRSPLQIVAFSAGVVGAITAAQVWQGLGGRVDWLIAVDGWGVPAWASFPVYRVSHDRFTHDTSALLGGDALGFYADPPVPHWEVWRSPQTAIGWQTHTTGCSHALVTRTSMTAATFIQSLSPQSPFIPSIVG